MKNMKKVLAVTAAVATRAYRRSLVVSTRVMVSIPSDTRGSFTVRSRALSSLRISSLMRPIRFPAIDRSSSQEREGWALPTPRLLLIPRSAPW